MNESADKAEQQSASANNHSFLLARGHNRHNEDDELLSRSERCRGSSRRSLTFFLSLTPILWHPQQDISFLLLMASNQLANRLSIAGGGGRPVHATDPASVRDRWVRQLEEETGAICESRVDVGGSVSATGAATGAGPGPSTLSSRRSTLSKAAGQRVLPDFYMGSYESALRVAEKEMRPMCVVLVSEEHDDVVDFKRCVRFLAENLFHLLNKCRSTLVDEELNRILRENDFVVWGGT